MPDNRVFLVSFEEMRARFTQTFSLEVVMREAHFYGYLASNAGQMVGAKELCLIMVQAMSGYYPTSLQKVSFRDHVRAMVGDSESATAVLEEFLDIMTRVGKRHQQRRVAQ